jgi:hypothetical protein
MDHEELNSTTRATLRVWAPGSIAVSGARGHTSCGESRVAIDVCSTPVVKPSPGHRCIGCRNVLIICEIFGEAGGASATDRSVDAAMTAGSVHSAKR